MVKLYYFSINKEKLVTLVFFSLKEACDFVATHSDDIDMLNHFVKIVMEEF